MKKTLVAIAALAATGAFAQTLDGKPGVQITGLFNAGYSQLSYKGVNINGIEQNGAGTTRFHLRGLEDLGGGQQAYFNVETDLSVLRNDANQGVITKAGNAQIAATASATNYTAAQTQKGVGSTFGNGELAVGTRGSFGDVAFGALNNGGLTNFVAVASPVQGTSYGGGYGSIIGADPTLGVVRWNNSFKYATPTMSGFTAQYIYSAKQTSQANTFNYSGVAATTVNTGLGQNDQIGAKELSLRYEQGPLTVGYVNTQTDLTGASFCATATSTASPILTAGKNQPCYLAAGSSLGSAYNKGNTIGNGYKATQNGLAAKYVLNSNFTVSGGLQQTKLKEIVAGDGDQVDRSAQIATLTYVNGIHTLFGTYGTVKENALNNQFNGKKSTMTAIGYNYALSKTSYLYGRYETLTDDAGTIAATYGDSVNLVGTDSSNKRTRSQFGLAMNF